MAEQSSPMNTTENTQRKKLNITLFDVLNYLIKYSSPTKFVSINDISMYLTFCITEAEQYGVEDFHNLDEEQLLNATTEMNNTMLSADGLIDESVRTQVKRLIKGNLGKALISGISIQAANRAQDTKGQLRSDIEMYYVKMPLTDTQIIMLRDAISVFPYAEPNITEQIVDSLNGLTPEYNRIEYSAEIVNADKYRGSYYENLNEIRKAFSTITDDEKPFVPTEKDKKFTVKKYAEKRKKPIKKLRFVYCEYDENKQLVVRKKNGKSERIVNPMKIMWVNGYYYLVTAYYDEEKSSLRYINYRIDRMKNVQCLNENADDLEQHLPRPTQAALRHKRSSNKKPTDRQVSALSRKIDDNGFSIGEYRYSNPIMYTGNELDEVILRCSKSLMNNVIDTFGFDIYSRLDPDDSGKVLIKLHKVAPAGVKLFALEYGESCEVLSPPELRKTVKNAAKIICDKYV